MGWDLLTLMQGAELPSTFSSWSIIVPAPLPWVPSTSLLASVPALCQRRLFKRLGCVCVWGGVDTQPQIPSSRPICSHPRLSPIKMIQIIVFVAGCRCCCRGRTPGDLGLDLAQQDSLGPKNSQVGSTAGQSCVPTMGSRGWLVPLGEDRPSDSSGGICSPPVGGCRMISPC